MNTSLEIAKILSERKKQTKTLKSGFDSALVGLGVSFNVKDNGTKK